MTVVKPRPDLQTRMHVPHTGYPPGAARTSCPPDQEEWGVGSRLTDSRLRLMSYNIQVGIQSSRPHHYLTNLWKHVLHARCRLANINRIADLVHGFDIVGMQELDAGSHRTGYINLTEYIAARAGLPFWHHQLNRDFGAIAQHGIGLLGRFHPDEIVEHKLPGHLPGRGGLMARFGHGDDALVVMLIHLSLNRHARQRQLDYIAAVVNDFRHVVLMGDLNCEPHSREISRLSEHTCLRVVADGLHTYPSWKPRKKIDYILISPSLDVVDYYVMNRAYSDHLPIAMEIELPPEIIASNRL